MRAKILPLCPIWVYRIKVPPIQALASPSLRGEDSDPPRTRRDPLQWFGLEFGSLIRMDNDYIFFFNTLTCGNHP